MDINDDQFSLDSNQVATQSKATQSKSMKTVYEELAKKNIKEENTGKKVKKEKNLRKESKIKKQKPTKTKQIKKQSDKDDNSCRYIRNRGLQNQLKERALAGVLQIMNMISKTQAERNVQ